MLSYLTFIFYRIIEAGLRNLGSQLHFLIPTVILHEKSNNRFFFFFHRSQGVVEQAYKLVNK